MKILVDRCDQPRPYADSKGVCVILLEQGDNADEIIKQYTAPREWYEEKYSLPRRVNEFPDRLWNGDPVVYTGDLIVFNTTRAYLD